MAEYNCDRRGCLVSEVLEDTFAVHRYDGNNRRTETFLDLGPFGWTNTVMK